LMAAVMMSSFSAEWTAPEYTRPMAVSLRVWDTLAPHKCRLR
jgi:hypothetical protein